MDLTTTTAAELTLEDEVMGVFGTFIESVKAALKQFIETVFAILGAAFGEDAE